MMIAGIVKTATIKNAVGGRNVRNSLNVRRGRNDPTAEPLRKSGIAGAQNRPAAELMSL